MSITVPSERNILADQLERSFRGGAWHGPSLIEILEKLDASEASWRFAPGLHTILETVEHLAFWFDDTRRRLEGAAPDADLQDQSWGRLHADPQADWESALAAVESAHRGLREALLRLPEDSLGSLPPGSDTDVRSLVLGTLQHSAYHAGQIQLLRRFAESRKGSAA
jgi:uncharacterized damage-inducible protein DinB